MFQSPRSEVFETSPAHLLIVQEDGADTSLLVDALETYGFEHSYSIAPDFDAALDMLLDSSLSRKRELAILLAARPGSQAALRFTRDIRTNATLRRSIIFVLEAFDPDCSLNFHSFHIAGYFDLAHLRESPDVLCGFLSNYLHIVQYPLRE